MRGVKKKARDLQLGKVIQKEMVPAFAMQHPVSYSLCIGCGLQDYPHLDCCLRRDCPELGGHHMTH